MMFRERSGEPAARENEERARRESGQVEREQRRIWKMNSDEWRGEKNEGARGREKDPVREGSDWSPGRGEKRRRRKRESRTRSNRLRSGHRGILGPFGRSSLEFAVRAGEGILKRVE